MDRRIRALPNVKAQHDEQLHEAFAHGIRQSLDAVAEGNFKGYALAVVRDDGAVSLHRAWDEPIGALAVLGAVEDLRQSIVTDRIEMYPYTRHPDDDGDDE